MTYRAVDARAWIASQSVFVRQAGERRGMGLVARRKTSATRGGVTEAEGANSGFRISASSCDVAETVLPSRRVLSEEGKS